jgi:hypothetical protein
MATAKRKKPKGKAAAIKREAARIQSLIQEKGAAKDREREVRANSDRVFFSALWTDPDVVEELHDYMCSLKDGSPNRRQCVTFAKVNALLTYMIVTAERATDAKASA